MLLQLRLLPQPPGSVALIRLKICVREPEKPPLKIIDRTRATKYKSTRENNPKDENVKILKVNIMKIVRK